jgi:hypothetical protein
MKRVLVITLAATLASSSVSFAESSLLASGSRAVKQQVAQKDAPKSKPALSVSAAQQGQPAPGSQPGLTSSGMGKGKKIMIALAAGIGFAAAVYTIDHNVLDVTPSSLGTRQD